MRWSASAGRLVSRPRPFGWGAACKPSTEANAPAARTRRPGITTPRSRSTALVLSLFALLSPLLASAQAFTLAELEAGYNILGLTVSEDQSALSKSVQGTMSVDAAGNVTGGTLLYSDGTSHPLTGGHLGIDANGGVTGSVSIETKPTNLQAQMLPNQQAIVGVGISGAVGKRQFTYFVLIKQTQTQFAQGDLGDNWRIFALQKSTSAGGAWLQGTLSIDFNGAVTGVELSHPNLPSDPISAGTLTLSSGGAVSGTFVAANTTTTATTTLSAVMLPDKNLMVGVGSTQVVSGNGPASFAGVSFLYLERQSSETFDQAAAAGTWHLHDLAVVDNSPVGSWTAGTLLINASGHLSGTVTGPEGSAPFSGGPITVTAAGSVTGTIVEPGGSKTDISAIMLPSKDMIVGVNTITDPAAQGATTYGLFSLVKAPAIVQFSGSSYSVSERAGAATVTVTRSGSTTGTVTLDYATTAGGTAVAGKDYTAVSGTLSFGPGVMSRSFSVTVINNTIVDGPRTVNLTLSAPGGGAVLGTRPTAVLNILNEDVAGLVQFGAAAYSVKETAGSATITVTRSGGAASAVTVAYASSDGTAVAGTDYTAVSGTLTFGVGEMKQSITVPIINNAIADGNRSLTLTLSSPGGGATLGVLKKTTLSIVDDEQGLRFSAAAYSVKENAVSATISVIRTGPSTGALSVQYATSDDTAVAGKDYTEKSGTLSFGPGVMIRTFTVPVINNAIADNNRMLKLTLSAPGGGALLGTPAVATLTIVNEDLAGQVQFVGTGTYSVKENAGSATITVTRSGGAAGGVTVAYASSDGTAVAGKDYTAVSGTLSFGPGVMSRSFSVTVINNTIVDGPRTVNLTLSAPGGGAVLGTQATAVLTIQDILHPDLTMTQLSAPVGAVGRPLAIASTVRNLAGAPAAAGPFRVDFYLSTDNVLDGGDRLLGSRNVTGLGPLTSTAATTVVTVPADVTPGAYYVIAVADAGNQVVESDETNNTRATEAPIQIAPDVRGVYSLSGSSITLSGCANPANNGTFDTTGTITASSQSGANFSGSAALFFTNSSTATTLRIGIAYSAKILPNGNEFTGTHTFGVTIPPSSSVVASGNGTFTGTFTESPSEDSITVTLTGLTKSGIERCQINATLMGTK